MKLFAQIDSEDLLFKLIHEAGASFYRPLGNHQYEVAYFSGNRVVFFRGKISPERAKQLEQTSWRVSRIEIDEIDGLVKIFQVEL